MKFRLILCLFLLCFMMRTLPAMASWGSFVALGKNTVNSDPACAPLTLGGGQVLCAIVGVNNKVSSIVGP
jgi:hypothetical protein